MSVTTRRWIVDLSAVALLLAVPIAGFWPTFEGPGYLVAAIGAAVLGMGIAVLGALRRLGMLVLAAITIVVYFVFGAALALPHTALFGVIPSLESLRGLALGIVTSWKQLLTTVAPVSGADGLFVVPFLATLVAAVITTSLALRLKHTAWALIPAAAFLVAQIALGTADPAIPLVQGAMFAVVAIVWLALHEVRNPSQAAVPLGEDGTTSTPVGSPHRIAAAAAVVALAVIGGVAVTAFAAPAGPRYVLRDVVIPPFDVHDYPSPLQAFRGYVRDDAQSTLFTVSGLPEGARVRLATMDAYSGTVYNVSDEGAGSSSAFTVVRGNMSPDAEGAQATVRVEIGELGGVWMPDVGEVRNVTFEGDRAQELRRNAHYNEGTDTAVVTQGLREGDAYELDVVIPAVPSDASLGDTDFAPLKMPRNQQVPAGIAELAADMTTEAETPIERVRALQNTLSTEGFFSHGLEGDAVRSRAGHTSERISTLLGGDQWIGDDEQYAVAMALMARELGIPARVVMGFHPDEDAAPSGVFDANGENLHAWVEVAFDGVGWVPFDPTPPEDQIPNDETTKPKTQPKPQVLQPPPPQQEPADMPITAPEDEEPDDDEQGDLGAWGVVIAVAGGTLGLLAVLLAPFIVIGALKASRRSKRRAAAREADRISGGWDELVDRAIDYGTRVQPGATRVEDAAVVGTAFAEPMVGTLAQRADAEVFGPAEPTPADVDEFWRQVDELVGGMGRSRSLWQRLRARLNLRALLAGTRFALPAKRPATVPDAAAEEHE